MENCHGSMSKTTIRKLHEIPTLACGLTSVSMQLRLPGLPPFLSEQTVKCLFQRLSGLNQVAYGRLYAILGLIDSN